MSGEAILSAENSGKPLGGGGRLAARRRLRPRSARGRLQANPKRLRFVILVTHPETTDRRDFGGKPSNWRRYCEKFRNFVAWAEPDPKTAFFAFLEYPSTVAHSLQETVLPISGVCGGWGHGRRHGGSRVGKRPPWKKSGWAWPTVEILAVV